MFLLLLFFVFVFYEPAMTTTQLPLGMITVKKKKKVNWIEILSKPGEDRNIAVHTSNTAMKYIYILNFYLFGSFNFVYSQSSWNMERRTGR